MKHLYLTVLSLKAVACQVEWIASCLRPSAVELTLPLNAAECPKLSFARSGWGPGCLKGRHSTPLPSTRGRSWGVCPVEAHGYR